MKPPQPLQRRGLLSTALAPQWLKENKTGLLIRELQLIWKKKSLYNIKKYRSFPFGEREGERGHVPAINQ